jgi:hypothetical protein
MNSIFGNYVASYHQTSSIERKYVWVREREASNVESMTTIGHYGLPTDITPKN